MDGDVALMVEILRDLKDINKQNIIRNKENAHRVCRKIDRIDGYFSNGFKEELKEAIHRSSNITIEQGGITQDDIDALQTTIDELQSTIKIQWVIIVSGFIGVVSSIISAIWA